MHQAHLAAQGGSARGYQEFVYRWQTQRRPTRQAAGPYGYASLVLDVNVRYCRCYGVEGWPVNRADALLAWPCSGAEVA